MKNAVFEALDVRQRQILLKGTYDAELRFTARDRRPGDNNLRDISTIL